MRITRRAALGLLAAPPVLAQSRDWPNRPLRLIVPSAAGGYEVYARILAPRLGELLGQPVVVENKPGPDGNTFMFAHIGAISIGSSIYPNMPFDPVEEFASISVAVTSPLVWVVNPSQPFRTMPEFIARARAEPGVWRYGNPSSGSIPHLVAEEAKIRHQIDMPGVPYRSTVQSLTAVIANEVPITVDSLGASGGHIAGGRLRALAMTGRERSDRLPGVPTMMELGLDAREWVAWYAFMAPKGTPDDIIQKLNGAINQALRDEAIATRIRDLGAAPRFTTPAEMLTFIRAEREEFGAIARAGKIRVE
jgi:tripartite-type tricarboxylate transporter receptor subunit TctC